MIWKEKFARTLAFHAENERLRGVIRDARASLRGRDLAGVFRVLRNSGVPDEPPPPPPPPPPRVKARRNSPFVRKLCREIIKDAREEMDNVDPGSPVRTWLDGRMEIAEEILSLLDEDSKS